MECSVKENLDKILERSLGVKEGQQVPSELQENVEAKLQSIQNQMTLYSFEKPLGQIENGVLKYNHDNLSELEDAIDNYEEEYIKDFDNQFNSYLDSFEGDINLDSITPGENEVINNPHDIYVGNSPLYSFRITTNTPANLLEWKQQREAILSELKKKHSSYLKEGFQKNKEKISKINKSIQELEHDLKNIDTKDPLNVFRSINSELDSLDNTLDEVSTDPVQSSLLFETSNIVKRLEDLNMFFMGSNLLGDVFDINNIKTEEGLTYNRIKEFLSDEDYLKLSNRIKEITNKYHASSNKIVMSIIQSNTLVKEYLKTNSDWTDKRYELKKTKIGYDIVENPAGKEILEILEEYIDMDLPGDVNALSTFYGAATGGGILGSILHFMKESNTLSEQGLTLELTQRMTNSWQKIKLQEDSKGNMLADKLFRKDVNGVRSPYLESSYSDTYFDNVSTIREARQSFYKDATSEIKYGSWMAIEKNNTTKIDPRKLSIIKNLFGVTKEYGSSFASDVEIQRYEKELRDYLGDIMYEIEVKKALEKFVNYADQAEEGFTEWQKHNYNPFRFLDHYESSNYNKKDPSTASFLLPDYVHSIPNIKSKNFLNEEFYNNIENNKDLGDAWKDMYEALEYINPFLRSQGINVSALELPQYEDMLNREVMKDLSHFGKISSKLMNWFRKFHKSFFDPHFNKENQNDEEQGTEGINIFYTTSPKSRKIKMANTLSQLKEEELLKIAEQEGVKVTITFSPADNAKSRDRKIRKIANSIAQNRVNKTTSDNAHDSIKSMIDVVNNAKARESTLSTYNTFLNYAKRKAYGKNSYLYNYLDNWGQLNIIKRKYASSSSLFGVGERFVTTLKLRKKLFHKNENDVIEMLQKLLKPKTGDDKRNLKDLSVGSEDNPLYLSGTPGNFRISHVNPGERTPSHTLVPVSNEEAEALIEKYVKKEIDALGVDLTIGSLLQGLGGNVAKKVLQFNFTSGITNRTVGHLQTLKIAASGQYGFTETGVHQARKFLLGTNALKYMERAAFTDSLKNFVNKKLFKKAKEVESFKIFCEQLGLIQNRADELALLTKFNTGKFDTLGLRLKDFTVDANINNPEWHNQGEVILAVLYDTKVKDIHGNERRFFDGSSLIYKPGTLELKPEFDTAENRRSWVEFKSEEGKENIHATAMAKIQRAKEASQGNYNNEDIVPLHGSLTGKLSTMFMRYLPENMFHQWGSKKVDFRTGKINYKGSKIILMQHAPTLATYLGMMNTGRLAAAGGSILLFGAPIIGWGALASVIMGAGIMYSLRNTFLKRETFSREELKLAWSFFKEVSMRSVGTVMSSLSGSKYTLDVSKRINYNNSNFTEAERRMISESAQEVANKFNVYATQFLIAATLKGLWLLTRIDAGDDEDEILFKLKEIEGVMNKMVNIRENINEDIERTFNPYAFASTFESTIFGKQVYDWIDDTIKTTKDVFIEGKKDGGDLTHQILKSPFSPTPNNITKALFTDSGVSGFFEDRKIWQDLDRSKASPKEYFGDDIIKNRGKSDETINNEFIEKKRTKLRQEVKKEIERTLNKLDKYSGLEKEEKTKELTTKFMKKYRKSTFNNILKDFEFSEERERLEEFLKSIK